MKKVQHLNWWTLEPLYFTLQRIAKTIGSDMWKLRAFEDRDFTFGARVRKTVGARSYCILELLALKGLKSAFFVTFWVFGSYFRTLAVNILLRLICFKPRMCFGLLSPNDGNQVHFSFRLYWHAVLSHNYVVFFTTLSRSCFSCILSVHLVHFKIVEVQPCWLITE